mmetsp:Transcript_37641/g.76603  ORF Transcript_37641/g.76603 Transcript_37641/m.76603 type:complete len:484 (-) Transcript_37641:1655-3106(-)
MRAVKLVFTMASLVMVVCLLLSLRQAAPSSGTAMQSNLCDHKPKTARDDENRQGTEYPDQKQPISALIQQIRSKREPHSDISDILSSLGGKKIPVAAFTNEQRPHAIARHLIFSGIDESSVLEKVSASKKIKNTNPLTVWVGDASNKVPREIWCADLYRSVRRSQKYRRRHEKNMPPTWPIFIIDYTDTATPFSCPQIERAVGAANVYYSRRSVVHDRSWNPSTGWVDLGRKVLQHGRQVVQPAPYPVRTDIVQALDEQLQLRNLTLSYPIEELPRSLDVVHLWPLPSKQVKGQGSGGVGTFHSNLRTTVSKIVKSLGRQPATKNLRTFAGLAGEASGLGRTGVSPDYIETMLDAKLFLVVQRDAWEDHYRLMEAMIHGCMVLTDRMLSLPPGLQNGTHLIEFTSESDLRHLISYYLNHPAERLAIAGRGREVAMSQHRSWHRLEEIIFGRKVTDCSVSGIDRLGCTTSRSASHQCPYTVHAS